MGRIKTKLIKRRTKELMSAAGDTVKEEFASNKKAVEQFMKYESKKMRNIVAGYATRLKKAKEEV